jgi:hypothetical protein
LDLQKASSMSLEPEKLGFGSWLMLAVKEYV